MEDRAEGFYWISEGGCAPEVAAWSGGHWWVAGSEEPAIGTLVAVLGERLRPPASGPWDAAEARGVPERCGEGRVGAGLDGGS